MAWSEAARAAALEVRRRKLVYGPGKNGVHIGRSVMARYLRDARSTGLRGRGRSLGAAKFATGEGRYYTSVKGAHFVDQGLKGTVWRHPKKPFAPNWASKRTMYYRR